MVRFTSVKAHRGATSTERGGEYDLVVVAADHEETTYRTRLSHGVAMTLAEALQREGKAARVMHVVGSARYEVDRYPLR
jgi:hypothetical protein